MPGLLQRAAHHNGIVLLQVQQRPVPFDQLTLNRYEPGEGIRAHVDLLRFDNGVAIVSLGSPAVMSFTRGPATQRILLQPGDLLLLEGEARCATLAFLSNSEPNYSSGPAWAAACMWGVLRRMFMG